MTKKFSKEDVGYIYKYFLSIYTSSQMKALCMICFAFGICFTLETSIILLKKIIYLSTLWRRIRDIKVKRKNIQTNSHLNMFLQFTIKSIICSCTIHIAFKRGRFTIQNENSIYNVNTNLNQILTIYSGHPKSKDELAIIKET